MDNARFRQIIRETVDSYISDRIGDCEKNYHSRKNGAIEKAFTKSPIKGSDILGRDGVSVVRGSIVPERFYDEHPYVFNPMPGDVVIEYPDGTRHTLSRHTDMDKMRRQMSYL